MANAVRGGVSLRAGDRTLTLSFSTNALCELEDAVGKPTPQIIDDLQDAGNVRMSLVRKLVWAALLDHQPGTTIEEAGEIADSADPVLDDDGQENVGIQACMIAVGRALALAFPPKKEGKSAGKGNPQKAKAR